MNNCTRNPNTCQVPFCDWSNCLLHPPKESAATPPDVEQFTEFYQEMELGLGSAIAIIKECKIVIPEEHEDPTAIPDCIRNVYNSYRELQEYAKKYQAGQSAVQDATPQEGSKK